MLTPPLRRFLADVVYSTTHLHLIQLFRGRPALEAPPRLVADLLCRDVWSVEQALTELAACGVMRVVRSGGGEPRYRFAPTVERRAQIEQLLSAYDDPLLRHELQRAIRAEENEQRTVRQASAGGLNGRFGDHGLLLTEL